MLEEYDIEKLNPRPNPYAKELKMGTEEPHRIIGGYFDFELADRNRMLRDKMRQPIMDMLEETEKRAKKQVWRESVEAIMSQGYTQTEALRLLKIPEDEYRDIMVADGHNTEK